MTVTQKPATTRKPATRAPAKKVVEEAKQEAPRAEETVATVVDEYAARLDGKTVQELLQLRKDSVVEEDRLKRALVLMRQRAANLASTTGVEVEQEIMTMKAAVAKEVDWLRAVDKRLENEYLDIYGAKRY